MVYRVLGDLIGKGVSAFVDDIAVYGPKVGEAVDVDLPSEAFGDVPASVAWSDLVAHVELVLQVLKRLEAVGLTVSGFKCVFGTEELSFVGHRVSAAGLRLDESKLHKLDQLKTPTNISEVRTLLGLAGYYRKFVRNFSKMAAPISDLLSVSGRFEWGERAEAARRDIIDALSNAPCLLPPDYSKPFYISTDACKEGLGAVLEQRGDDGHLHPVRYESRKTSTREKAYGVTELECLAVLFGLKKFRQYVFGRNFKLRTDHSALRWLLTTAPLAPGSRLMRWISFIQQFSFDVEHVPGKTFGHADGLSRLTTAVELGGEEDDIAVRATEAVQCSDDEIVGSEFEDIYNHVISNQGAEKEGFSVINGLLYRLVDGSRRRVLAKRSSICRVLTEMHDGLVGGGHRGREATLRKVRQSFWWRRWYDDVVEYVSTCELCQKRNSGKHSVPERTLTWSHGIFDKVHVDLVVLPKSRRGNVYLVVAVDDLSGWVEVKPLRTNSTATVAKFLLEEVVCRHGMFRELVSDNGEFASELVDEILRRLGIVGKKSSPYHPQGNGRVERSHQALIDALAKFCHRKVSEWDEYVSFVAWSKRVTVERTTGYTPFELVCGRLPVFPVHLEFLGFGFGATMTTEELLIARAEQLAQLVGIRETARKRQFLSRVQDMVEWNKRCDAGFEAGDMVLMVDETKGKRTDRKLDFRWRGPYVVVEKVATSTYKVAEVDGAVMRRPVAGARLKRFSTRAPRA
jgi:hypothetical protein